MKHVISFSGGKDSMATLLLMLDHKIQIDDIIFADTGLEFPEMYKYLVMVEQYIGRKITRLSHPSRNFENLFYQRKRKGNYVGQIYSFPRVRGCYLQSYLKMAPIKRYKRTIGPHISYLGIAYDEPERYTRLGKNERSLLYELKMTQTDSMAMVEERGLLNPLYQYFDRLGCWLCPQQSIKSFRKLRRHFPGLWYQLMFYGKEAEKYAQYRLFAEIKPGWTVAELDARFELEDRQLCLFDELKEGVA